MFSIAQDRLADDALLKTYRGSVRPERWGKYGDCFSVTVDRAGDRALGGRFRLLLGFHVVYSQLLLHAAKIGVTKTPKAAS